MLKSPADDPSASAELLISTPKKPAKPTKEDTVSITAQSYRVLEEESPPKTGKYTGCNCSKSQCLKMYCTCFAVGRICDQVLPSLPRAASARPAKTMETTWSEARPSTISSPRTLSPFPAVASQLR